MYEMSLIFLMSIWRKCGVNWSRKTRFFCSFHILFRLDCQKNIHAAHRWMMACAFFFLSPSPLLDSSPVIFIKIHSSLSLVARENHYFIDYRSISVNRSLPSIIDAHFMSQFVMFFSWCGSYWKNYENCNWERGMATIEFLAEFQLFELLSPASWKLLFSFSNGSISLSLSLTRDCFGT